MIIAARARRHDPESESDSDSDDDTESVRLRRLPNLKPEFRRRPALRRRDAAVTVGIELEPGHCPSPGAARLTQTARASSEKLDAPGPPARTRPGGPGPDAAAQPAAASDPNRAPPHGPPAGGAAAALPPPPDDGLRLRVVVAAEGRAGPRPWRSGSAGPWAG